MVWNTGVLCFSVKGKLDSCLISSRVSVKKSMILLHSVTAQKYPAVSALFDRPPAERRRREAICARSGLGAGGVIVVFAGFCQRLWGLALS